MNTHSFTLHTHIRVGDVSESVRSVEGGGGGVVLMVADGRQMEPTDLVAGYAAGMVSSFPPPSLPLFLSLPPSLCPSLPPSLSVTTAWKTNTGTLAQEY